MFDIKDGETKFMYPMINPTRHAVELDVMTIGGIVFRKVCRCATDVQCPYRQ